MALVWQCARCGATDPGTDDQREGRQPPTSWLPIYAPQPHGGRRQDWICDHCAEALDAWLRPEETTNE